MRLCVISPFVDKQHGTERALAELLERLSTSYGVEIGLYTQKVADLSVVPRNRRLSASSDRGTIYWRKVPSIPGPHLLQFLCWYFTNRFQRGRDLRSDETPFDLIYSSGINASDADAITVHVVFHAYCEKVRGQLSFLHNSPLEWPILIHRRLYYRLVRRLESRVYASKRVALFAVSQTVADQLNRYFGQSDVPVVRHGVDTEQFNPAVRLKRRKSSRALFGIAPEEFVFLLIGNDWKNKGLDALLAGVAECKDLPVRLLVVGKDSSDPYLKKCRKLGVESRITFLLPSPDVMQFYAAADAYAGPSLEDAYGLPILESMACGLPVIVSAAAGASEIVVNGENGLILRDPRDASELARLLRQICATPELAKSLGAAAEKTATAESWDAHAARMFAHFEKVVQRKRRKADQS